jgi:hypothetical protein
LPVIRYLLGHEPGDGPLLLAVIGGRASGI